MSNNTRHTAVSIRNLSASSFVLIHTDLPTISGQQSRSESRSTAVQSSLIDKKEEASSLNESCGRVLGGRGEDGNGGRPPVPIEPFATRSTRVQAATNGEAAQQHIVIQDDERRGYTVVTGSSASGESRPLQPLNLQDSSSQYTSIYNATGCHITLLNKPDPAQWMRSFPDNIPLTALSIPGTHNTATSYRALPSVRCQIVSPLTQLQNGIRFFDLRLQANTSPLKNPNLLLVHAAFPVSFTGSKHFSTILATIKDFLRKNPSETLILSLKREGVGKATDADLARALRAHYIPTATTTNASGANENTTSDANLWYTSPRIPTLGEVRGKIILLRRFALPDDMTAEGGFGLDAREWEYNSPDCVHGAVRVQDCCEVLRPGLVGEKIRFVREHFVRAGNQQVGRVAPLRINCSSSREEDSSAVAMEGSFSSGPLFLNFLSGSNFWRKGCWPEKLARKINPVVLRFLCEEFRTQRDAHDDLGLAREEERGDGGLGVVVCDWVGENGDWDLVRCIIGMNSRLLWKIKQGQKSSRDNAVES